MEKKSSLRKRTVSVSSTGPKKASIKDDQLVVIKEGGLMSEISSGIDAVANIKYRETDLSDIQVENGERYSDERGRKSVKIDGEKKVHPIVVSSSQVIIEEAEVEIDECISVLFGFQSVSEVQRFKESVCQPSLTTSLGLSAEGLQRDRIESLRSSDVKSTTSESKTDCPFFKNIVTFSETFVDNIIQEAEITVNNAESLESAKTADGEYVRYDSQDSRQVFQIHVRTFTGWPSIGEFNCNLGAEKIDEYLSSFKTEEDWFYGVYYRGVSYDGWSSIFHYDVKWSLPTPRYPIVQAFATMYFDIEVSLTVPSHCKVKVSYWYEGNNFRFDPEISEFNDFTLNHILDKKIKWFQTVTY
ncbi:unnamed protein product [Callosobruchus maculatus]|uniref:Uncharacterized protein n=1 Tax=Callosobruchus maculatus TaxID=64391 RepID=A0A653DIJ5_CALMS|nr:unnamed protein product [Callosobruchus maculatus]